MGVKILYGLLIFLFVRGLIYVCQYPRKTRKKIEALKSSQGFSSVDRDTVQEVRNVINFLLEREYKLGVLSGLSLGMYHCHRDYIEKKNHPELLAFFRVAHLLGYTVSVRQKDKAEQERAANSDICLAEHVSEIQEDNTDYKRLRELDNKKSKYGYYK